MLISHSHKFIFIKTKKTAGSTIESVIVDNAFDPSVDLCTGSKIDGTARHNVPPKKPNEPDGHKPWFMVKQYVTDEQWQQYHKFTVERNPWDKVVSEFYWKQSSDKRLQHSDDDRDNFETFLSLVSRHLYIPPLDWSLYGDQHGLQVDQVIQYNTLAPDLASMFDQLSVDIDQHTILGTRKKSGFRKKHYSELYRNSKVIDTIASWYKQEIQFFGYRFGE